MGGVQLKYEFWGGLKERQKDKREFFTIRGEVKREINKPVIKHSKTWEKVDPKHNTGPKIV